MELRKQPFPQLYPTVRRHWDHTNPDQPPPAEVLSADLTNSPSYWSNGTGNKVWLGKQLLCVLASSLQMKPNHLVPHNLPCYWAMNTGCDFQLSACTLGGFDTCSIGAPTLGQPLEHSVSEILCFACSSSCWASRKKIKQNLPEKDFEDPRKCTSNGTASLGTRNHSSRST